MLGRLARGANDRSAAAPVGEIPQTWDEAFRVDRPVVVEAITDPEVPPLPPHITVKQARMLTSALLRGDPGARGIIRQAHRDVIESWIPHRG